VNTDEPQIEEFLLRIKSEFRSSPAGIYWNDFYKILCRRAPTSGMGKPPVPLILAASDESNSAKHYRLGEQLRWAQANGVLEQAFQFLGSLKPDQWNHCTPEKWNESSYWSVD
jgi:hypothetical protein